MDKNLSLIADFSTRFFNNLGFIRYNSALLSSSWLHEHAGLHWDAHGFSAPKVRQVHGYRRFLYFNVGNTVGYIVARCRSSQNPSKVENILLLNYLVVGLASNIGLLVLVKLSTPSFLREIYYSRCHTHFCSNLQLKCCHSGLNLALRLSLWWQVSLLHCRYY